MAEALADSNNKFEDHTPWRVWAEDVPGKNGAKRYYAATIEGFGRLMREKGAGGCHFYEMIFAKDPCWAYFDLELAKDGADESDGDDLAARWLATFADAAERAFYAPTGLFAEHAALADASGLYDACPDLDVQLRLELDRGAVLQTCLGIWLNVNPWTQAGATCSYLRG